MSIGQIIHKEVDVMTDTNKVVARENKGIDPNSDTALFHIVNRHAEEMKSKKMQEDYERLLREEEIRKMEKMCEKHKKFENICNFFKNAVFVLSLIFLMWVFMSWVNVIMHNTQPGGYEFLWSWNFFKVFFGQ
jgi:hypothetical protein